MPKTIGSIMLLKSQPFDSRLVNMCVFANAEEKKIIHENRPINPNAARSYRAALELKCCKLTLRRGVDRLLTDYTMGF